MQFIVPNLDVCMPRKDVHKNTIVAKFPWYRVSAVLSTLTSGQTINVASILGAYRMPLVGAASTSEDVSPYYIIHIYIYEIHILVFEYVIQ